MKTQYKYFAPRTGFAYRVRPNTVIRGGFGISYTPFPDNTYAYNYPIRANNSYQPVSSSGFAPAVLGDGTTVATFSAGFPAPVAGSDPVQRNHPIANYRNHAAGEAADRAGVHLHQSQLQESLRGLLESGASTGSTLGPVDAACLRRQSWHGHLRRSRTSISRATMAAVLRPILRITTLTATSPSAGPQPPMNTSSDSPRTISLFRRS